MEQTGDHYTLYGSKELGRIARRLCTCAQCQEQTKLNYWQLLVPPLGTGRTVLIAIHTCITHGVDEAHQLI